MIIPTKHGPAEILRRYGGLVYVVRYEDHGEEGLLWLREAPEEREKGREE